MTMQDLSRLQDPALLVPHLKVREQSINKDGTNAVVVVYIDARAAAEVLDAAMGPAGWSFTHDTPVRGNTGWLCRGRLTLHVQVGDREREVHHEDVGTGKTSTGDSDLETGAKGSVSDALKRAAAQAGVGRPLYSLSTKFLRAGDIEDVRGKKRVKRPALDRCRSEWQNELSKVAEGWASSRTLPAPAPVEIPDGFRLDHNSGELVPDVPPPRKPAELLAELKAMGPEEVVLDTLRGLGITSTGPLADADTFTKAKSAVTEAVAAATPTPADPGAGEGTESADPYAYQMDHLAQMLGAPGSETPSWKSRFAFMVAQEGDDTQAAVGTLSAVTGATTRNKLADTATWIKVLSHYVERADIERSTKAA